MPLRNPLLSPGLMARVVIIFLTGIALSGTILYIAADTPLALSYGEIITSASFYKLEILKKSILIYAVFTLLMLTGVTALGTVYSRWFLDPFYRVKAAAKAMSEGNLDINIHFREEDVFHPVAVSLIRIARNYGERYGKLDRATDELLEAAEELEAAVKASDREQMKNIFGRLKSTAHGMKNSISEVKF